MVEMRGLFAIWLSLLRSVLTFTKVWVDLLQIMMKIRMITRCTGLIMQRSTKLAMKSQLIDKNCSRMLGMLMSTSWMSPTQRLMI